MWHVQPAGKSILQIIQPQFLKQKDIPHWRDISTIAAVNCSWNQFRERQVQISYNTKIFYLKYNPDSMKIAFRSIGTEDWNESMICFRSTWERKSFDHKGQTYRPTIEWTFASSVSVLMGLSSNWTST